MNRREFLRLAAIGGGSLVSGRWYTGPVFADAPPGKAFYGKDAERELAQHRIAGIQRRRSHDRFPRIVGANARRGMIGQGRGFQIRVITTDKGATGWAMGTATEAQMKPLIGAKVSELFDLKKGTLTEAHRLDLALHDLVGRILGRPVYELLGGAGPVRVPLYSGAIHFDDLMPTARPRGVPGVLESCRQDHEEGYRTFKLKIGRGYKWMPRIKGIQRDIDVTIAVRDAFRDCRILVDADDGYTVKEMLNYVRATADCSLVWIEEPFEEDPRSLKLLRETLERVGSGALIADGKTRKKRFAPQGRYGGYDEPFIRRLFVLAKQRLLDVVLLDLEVLGFTRWRHLMPELVKRGIQASPQAGLSTLRTYYVAHLAAGLGHIPIVEGVPGVARGVDTSAYQLADGKLVMPNAPGFGLKLSE